MNTISGTIHFAEKLGPNTKKELRAALTPPFGDRVTLEFSAGSMHVKAEASQPILANWLLKLESVAKKNGLHIQPETRLTMYDGSNIEMIIRYDKEWDCRTLKEDIISAISTQALCSELMRRMESGKVDSAAILAGFGRFMEKDQLFGKD